jgi:hypothetical protein
MAAVADKFKKFDQKIRTGEVAVLKKQVRSGAPQCRVDRWLVTLAWARLVVPIRWHTNTAGTH